MFTASQCEMVTPILWSFSWEFWAGIVLTVVVICATFVWFFFCKNNEVVALRKVNLEQRLDADVSNDPILEPKHKIFLSHSGVQKEFVELLCLAMESRCHYPFFDKRPSSLPKGEKFADLIFQAVAQCKVLVVVVSDDYFMSKWPMMELHAFVQAMEAINDRPANARSKYILPLFYKLSVEEFRNKERRKKWAKEWKKLAKEGGTKRGMDVNAWKNAVEVLGNYNGISYNPELKEIKAYYDEIVSHICGIINADVKWDDTHVQGKSQICEVLCKSIQSVGLMEKYKCKIVGIFGVGGIGKTTVCKTLYNELSDEYEGRVCHIELESQATTLSLVESLRKLVILLTSKNSEFVQNLDEGQCKHILRISGVSQRTFIAVDNVCSNHESIMQAKTILDAPKFHEGSLVIVTARSRSILEMLGIHGEACVEMPELGQDDAGLLFLYHAMGGKQFVTKEEWRDILECIQRCYFSKGGESGFHYHPLALKSLGVQANFIGKKPSEWVEKLTRARNFNYMGGGNPVFDILRSGFDMLRPYEQSLFMDLLIYRPFSVDGCDFESQWGDMVEWLCLVHRVTEDAIKSRLDSLMRKGLLQDMDWTSGRIIVHDLYMDFAVMESEGKFNESIDFEHWRCIRTSISDLTELDRSPSGGCWQNLNRVCIHDSRVGYCEVENQIARLEGIKWQFYSNVVVLELYSFFSHGGSLNLEGMNCLRSLSIDDVVGLERVEGLVGLRNLVFFECSGGGWPQTVYDSYTSFMGGGGWRKSVYDGYTSIVGQLPTSLKVLYVRDHICLNLDMLLRCNNLVKLKLDNIQVLELKLRSCSKLQSLHLREVKQLHSMCLPSNLSGVCALKSLEVHFCNDLVNIQGLDEYIGLEQLSLRHCPRYKLPNLRNVTKLQVLRLAGGEEVVGSFIPWQLREFYYECPDSNNVPSLKGCKQLEVLYLHVGGGSTRGATNLKDLEDLPALRHLMLYDIIISSRWPDLSKSRELEVIRLGHINSEMELQEDNIRMLVSLPMLQPLEIGAHVKNVPIKLDLRRRQVLFLNYSTGCYEESNLDIPPINLNDLIQTRFSL